MCNSRSRATLQDQHSVPLLSSPGPGSRFSLRIERLSVAGQRMVVVVVADVEGQASQEA